MTINPPEHLKNSAATWRELVETYDLASEVGLLEVVTRACEQLDRAEAARAEIERHGVLVATERHGLKANPALAVERLAVETFNRLVRSLPGPEDDDR